MRWNSRCRIAFAGIGISVCFSVFSWRLIDLQLVRHDELSLIAAQTHSQKREMYHRRGVITDRNGEILADNLPMKTVFADGSLMEKRDEIAAIVSTALNLDITDLRKRLDFKKENGEPLRYIVLKREVPELEARALMQQLSDAKLKGIGLDHDMARFYPNGQMLSHVIGVLDHNHQGIQGIEMTMDHYLRGQDGYRFVETDKAGRELSAFRGLERLPRDGYNVKLTIDMGLQSIVEKELDAACAEYKPQGATVIMMQPDTGDILAMAVRPTFNLNDFNNTKSEDTRNRAVLDVYEPGSVFKIVAISGAIEDKLVTPETSIYCANGAFSYGGAILKDHHPYGNLTVHEIIVKSSNVGTAKVALQLGENRLHEYVRLYGFGDVTGVLLPGEVRGIVHPVSRWDKLTITRMPIGQGISVTPIQILTAMSAIANGGRLLSPRIVRAVSNSNGDIVDEFPPKVVRRVVSEDTAAKMRSALHDVVGPNGTAKLAALENWTVAGKTGTAQKPLSNGRGYGEGKYIVSFAGFVPAEKPAFAMLVVFDEANTVPGGNYGGLVAAPVFAKIADKTARYLDLEPCIDHSAPSAGRIALTSPTQSRD